MFKKGKIMKFDIEYIEKLAKVLADNSLTEISLEDGEQAITLRNEVVGVTAAPVVAAPVAQPQAAQPAQASAPAEQKEVKKGRARGRSRKIKEADVLAENTAQTVINEASEMAPVIAENAAIKPDEPEQPAEVQSEVKAEEPEAEAKPAKRTRRPNRNSQKRTRKPVKKDAEE